MHSQAKWRRRTVSLLAILLVQNEAVGPECRHCGCGLVCTTLSLDVAAIGRRRTDAGHKVRTSVERVYIDGEDQATKRRTIGGYSPPFSIVFRMVMA